MQQNLFREPELFNPSGSIDGLDSKSALTRRATERELGYVESGASRIVTRDEGTF